MVGAGAGSGSLEIAGFSITDDSAGNSSGRIDVVILFGHAAIRSP
jgi:hypothetical protein